MSVFFQTSSPPTCVAEIPHWSWTEAPHPSTADRDQITSEWMVNTACLASAANKSIGFTCGRWSVWSEWCPTQASPGMGSMYRKTCMPPHTSANANIHRHSLATKKDKAEKPQCCLWWKHCLIAMATATVGQGKSNHRFHHLSCKDENYLSCPTFNSKMIWYQVWSTRTEKAQKPQLSCCETHNPTTGGKSVFDDPLTSFPPIMEEHQD